MFGKQTSKQREGSSVICFVLYPVFEGFDRQKLITSMNALPLTPRQAQKDTVVLQATEER